MRNKKGQTLALAVMIAITIFIVGMLAVNYLTPEITRTREAGQLDCTNSTISDGTKLTCLAVDVVIPYYIILVVSVAGGIVASRFLM